MLFEISDLRLARRTVRGLAATMCAVLLAGCAAQVAFRDGKALVAQGRIAEGLPKLEEASRLDSNSAEYRLTYLQTRDKYAQTLVEQGDQAKDLGKYDLAEKAYRQALLIRAPQDRALAGLRSIDQNRRWDALLRDADAAITRKEWDVAQGKVKSVFLENPQHDAATKMLRLIEDRAPKPVVEPVLAAAYKKPLTIEFKDAPLRTVFEVISRTSRLNFLFDKDVKTDQRTSIFLRNSTIEAAVNWLLLTNQLEQRVLDGSSVLIYPATQAKQHEYQPLAVRSFYLSNADAKTVAGSLKTILKSRDVVVDERLNLIIMRDSPEAIRLASKLVLLHDVPEPEVMLEVEILEVKRGKLLDLGVRWPDQATLSLLPSSSGGALTLEDLRRVSRSSVGVDIGPGVITAKKQDSDTNILANPRIRARNHEKAKILIGERVPNITTTSTSTGFISESVTYVDVGLKLEVEPTVYLDNEVAIKIALEVSNIISQQQTKSGTLAYQLGTRNAQTVLRLKDGETQVLAGLINDEDRRTANKVPALGELPILGRLFGSQLDDASKTEIVLSITPRILRNVQRPEASALEFSAGTDSSLKSWPSETSAAVTAEPLRAVQQAVPPVVAPPTTTNTSAAPVAGAPLQDGAPTAPQSPQFQWAGPSSAKPGEFLTLQLMVSSGQAIISIPAVVAFDPAALEVVGVVEGDFLQRSGGQTMFTHHLDSSGKVFLTGTVIGGVGASGAGALAALSFRVLPTATADTRLQLQSVMPAGTGGRTLTVATPPPLVLSITR